MALERLSVITLERWDKLASHRCSSGTQCWKPLAASLANWSAISFPMAPLWADP